MAGSAHVQVSFVLATHNRWSVVRATLSGLQSLAAEADSFEIIVVDNRSTDGTPAMIGRMFPEVRLLALRRNLGSCAKAIGVNHATGATIVFLDDDSCPRPGSIARMLGHFASDPRLGAAGFTVELPDGRQETAALPDVFVGCGVGFRREALRQAGGLDRRLFMQAEEYDLSFRLVRAGWSIKVFGDLQVEHTKTPQARLSGRTVFYDTRNNLIVASRYLPANVFQPLWQDCLQRYRWIAETAGHPGAYARGRRLGLLLARRERRAWARWRLDAASFESLFRFNEIRGHMACLADAGVRRIALADLGKNVYPFVLAAREVELYIAAIGDDRLGGWSRFYRGIPVVGSAEALRTRPEAIVVANTSPVHASAARKRLAEQTSLPVHCWFATAPSSEASLLSK